MNLSPSSSLEILIFLVCLRLRSLFVYVFAQIVFTQIAVFWGVGGNACSGQYLPALETCYFETTRSDAVPSRFLGAAISGCARGQSTDRSFEKGVRYF
jgi:hypothetical protein